MAISTSAPELFTNVIGTFVTKGDMGLGTIVGSAVFNILAVGAACGIMAGIAINSSSKEDGGEGQKSTQVVRRNE
jgi:Ca2+/Na+ antiporter